MDEENYWKTRDYLDSIQPRFTERQWKDEIFSDHKTDINKLLTEYISSAKEKIAAINREKIRYRREYAAYGDLWALELLLDTADENIKLLQKYIKKCGFLLSERGDGIPGRITDADIARAREVPIYDLYPWRLRKVGNKFVGRCPFHEEKTGSFVVYINQNSWWCYGCSLGGSVIDYVMLSDKTDFLNAVKKLNNLA